VTLSKHIRFISLAVTLLVFWLILSGHYTPMLITIGVICALAVAALGWRMAVVDEEGHPVGLLPRVPIYWPWLFLEIIKSAWAVTKLILDPKLPISPTLVKIRAGQKTPIGVNIYANSITLTPGTITVEAEGKDLLVHAITSEGAADLGEGVMDRKVTWFEGAS